MTDGGGVGGGIYEQNHFFPTLHGIHTSLQEKCSQEFKKYQLFLLGIHSQDPSAHHIKRWCTCDKWKVSKLAIFHMKKY